MNKPEGTISSAHFSIGEVIRHNKFGYRGVIVDIDAQFSLSEQWYEQVARSRPPKDRPWYHVLVHGNNGTTYVAERHLQTDDSVEQIEHPLLGQWFGSFIDGRYLLKSHNRQ